MANVKITDLADLTAQAAGDSLPIVDADAGQTKEITLTNFFDGVPVSIDLASGLDFQINNTSVLNATTLGSGVVTSSLTTVGALNSGSITSGFGNIDIGASTLTVTGGGSLTGTWSNLGTVTTVDINGGTVDGATIGGASAAAGTFTTLTGTTAAGGMIATQAEMETATATDHIVTPGRTQYHPGVAKAWVSYDQVTPAINASHNVSSVTDAATGRSTVNWDTDFSSATYVCTATALAGVANHGVEIIGSSKAAGSCGFAAKNFSNNSDGDTTDLNVSAFGDQ